MNLKLLIAFLMLPFCGKAQIVLDSLEACMGATEANPISFRTNSMYGFQMQPTYPEAIGIMMEITLSTVSVFSNSIDGFEDFYVKRNTKKEAVWVAVVEVVKWYNDNAVSVGSG